jgi:ribosomal protein L29
MKRRDQLIELRGLTNEDLIERGRSVSEELMKLRFRKTTGQVEKSHVFKQLRGTLAKINTIRKEKANKNS